MYSRYSAGGGIGALVVMVIIGVLRFAARQELNHQVHQEDLSKYSAQFKTEAHDFVDQAGDPALSNYLHWDVNQWHDESFKEAQYEDHEGHGRSRGVVTKVDHDEYFAALFTHMLEQADSDKNTKAAKALEKLAEKIGLKPEGA